LFHRYFVKPGVLRGIEFADYQYQIRPRIPLIFTVADVNRLVETAYQRDRPQASQILFTDRSGAAYERLR
jgi:hypothetical protein